VSKEPIGDGTGARVMRKMLREKPTEDAVRSFWRYVQREARKRQARDGFVEWSLVQHEVDSALALLRLAPNQQPGDEGGERQQADDD